jgi:excinuclease ABC subunit C
MAQASSAMHFERAGAIRDRLAELEWLWERLNWLRQARKENTFVYPLVGADGRTVWYLIHRGRVRGACYQPTCSISAATSRELLNDVYAADPGPGVTLGQVDHVLLVSGWFRKNPAEKVGLLTPAEATGFEFTSIRAVEPVVTPDPERRKRRVASR